VGDHSGIQWTDATWNPTAGCTRVSAGCDHCYAFQLHDQRHAAYLAGRFPDAPAQYHRPFSEVQLIPERLSLPLRWMKPRRIFVDSMSDLFHPGVPDSFIDSVFAVMANAPQHTFQVLTKRPQRMHRYFSFPDTRSLEIEAAWVELKTGLPRNSVGNIQPPDLPLPNVWLGTSVENQEAAYRIDWLVKTAAAVRFLSCEPLLGPLDIEPWLMMVGPSTAGPWHDKFGNYRGGDGIGGQMITGRPTNDIHWVIVGGESGPDFRAVDPRWIEDLRDQCVEAQVPFFFKQWGGRTAKAGGRELDGRTWDEMPVATA
jgi:protein gp37